MPVDIRVSVIPGDKFCGTEGIFGLNTRNVQSGIFDRPGSKYNDVIELPKFVEMYISAVIDVADKPDITTIHNSVQRRHNAFNAWVIKSNAVANQTRRGRRAIGYVN